MKFCSKIGHTDIAPAYQIIPALWPEIAVKLKQHDIQIRQFRTGIPAGVVLGKIRITANLVVNTFILLTVQSLKNIPSIIRVLFLQPLMKFSLFFDWRVRTAPIPLRNKKGIETEIIHCKLHSLRCRKTNPVGISCFKRRTYFVFFAVMR